MRDLKIKQTSKSQHFHILTNIIIFVAAELSSEGPSP